MVNAVVHVGLAGKCFKAKFGDKFMWLYVFVILRDPKSHLTQRKGPSLCLIA